MTQGKPKQDSGKHTADTRNPEWDSYAPAGHGRTDEQIRADVHEALRGEGGEHETLSVSVGDGIVTLSGRVGSDADQSRLTQLIKSIPSVKDVKSQLKVESGA